MAKRLAVIASELPQQCKLHKHIRTVLNASASGRIAGEGPEVYAFPWLTSSPTFMTPRKMPMTTRVGS